MIEVNNTTKDVICRAKLKRLGQAFLDKHKLTNKTVSVAFVSSRKMATINNTYRQKNKTTDVLSFLADQTDIDDYLGEIIIDYNQIKKQAKESKKKILDELNFILVHGLLHLLGYADETELKRQEMIKLADKFLNHYYQKMV